ncbi:MAG TPA: RNA degradosome polyphosphate kinase, partial [Janibacter terrae]|nr:RNA degradosome polyphosphate kinase [Janibacter terrae]
MHRNLDRRVEALVRIKEARHVEQVFDLVERGMSGDYAHWSLDGDGRWRRVHLATDGTPLPDIQAALIAQHARRRRKARR